MNIKPLGDKVVIKMLEAEQKSKGGIVLPDQAKEEPQVAEVIAVGPGEVIEGKQIKMQLSVGDKVIFPKYMGVEIKLEGEQYLVLSQKDIFAILG